MKGKPGNKGEDETGEKVGEAKPSMEPPSDRKDLYPRAAFRPGDVVIRPGRLSCKKEVHTRPYRISRRPMDEGCLAAAVFGLPVGPVPMKRKGEVLECAFYVEPGGYTFRVCEAYPAGKETFKDVPEGAEDARDYFGGFLREPFVVVETRKTRTFKGPAEVIPATLEVINEADNAVTLELYPEQDWIKLWFDKYRLPPRGRTRIDLEVDAGRLAEGVNRGFIRAETAHFTLPGVEVVAERISHGRVLGALPGHVDLGTVYVGSTVTFGAPVKNLGPEPLTVYVEGDLPGYEKAKVYELPRRGDGDEGTGQAPLLAVEITEKLGLGPRRYGLRISTKEPMPEVVETSVSFLVDEVRLEPSAVDFGAVAYPGRVAQSVRLETASGLPPEEAVLAPEASSRPYLEIEAATEGEVHVRLDTSGLAGGGVAHLAASLRVGGRDVGLALPIKVEVLVPRPRIIVKGLYDFPVDGRALIAVGVVNDGTAGITFADVISEEPLSLIAPGPPFVLGPGEKKVVTFEASRRELATDVFPKSVAKKIKRLREFHRPFVSRVGFITEPLVAPALAADVRLYPEARRELFVNCVWPEIAIITTVLGCALVAAAFLCGIIISVMAGWA
jgi:hypothetical protein